MQLDICVLEIKGSINLGSICRLMENFNLGQLHLVQPRYIYPEKIEEFSCRGYHHFENAKVWDSFDELVEQDYHYIIGTTGKIGQDRKAVSLTNLESIENVFHEDSRVLLVFGRESRGLYNSELLHCNYTLHIPLEPDYPILNLSHAVSIVLYEIRRFQGMRKLCYPQQKQATSPEVNAFLRNIDECLNSFGYYDKKERLYQKGVLQELVKSKQFTTEEVRFLQGFLRGYKNRDKKSSK
jgi:tRNA/rRNA methyltransferase